MDQRRGQIHLIPRLPHVRRAAPGLQRDSRRGNDGDLGGSSSAIAGDYDDAPGRRGESLLRGEGGRSWGWGATASVITERPDRVGEV